MQNLEQFDLVALEAAELQEVQGGFNGVWLWLGVRVIQQIIICKQ